MPGVQKPHCDPWKSTMARWTGWRWSSLPSEASAIVPSSSLPAQVSPEYFLRQLPTPSTVVT